MGKLNSKQIDSLNTPGTYEDGEGLRLVVKPSGRKSWVLRFQLHGKRREMGLGSYPKISLKAARLEAGSKRRQLIEGIDPLAARDAERAAQLEALRLESAKKFTFETLAREYCEAHGAAWSEKWRKGWLRKLELYVFDQIGSLVADQIETNHVLDLLQPIWRSKTRTADEVRGQIEQVLDAAKARGFRHGENPARWRGHLENLLSRTEKRRARKREHFEAMPWNELPAFLTRLQSSSHPAAYAIRLLVLTGARSHMVRLARWDEFDLDAGIWSLPAERMKMRIAFHIPLAPQVITLLKQVPVVADSPYLFPGQGKTGVQHANAMRNLMHDLGHEHITLHGFRSTFRDWSGECTHYPREVCEMALAHDERNQTEGAYSRTDFFEKRKELMLDWAYFAVGPKQAPEV